MIEHIVTFSGSVHKRAAEASFGDGQGQTHQLPGWAWLVFFADFVVFFPVILYISYTLGYIYPTLAMIEDSQPLVYERVSLNDDSGPVDEDSTPLTDRPIKVDQESDLVTSSLRRINRLLYSTAGWAANFRGILCAFVLSLATGICGLIFTAIPFVPPSVGVLLASLVTVQLSAAWTHIVISMPSTLPFYQRLPPFRSTFEATVVPTIADWAVNAFVGFLPRFMAVSMGLSQWDVSNPTQIPQYHPDSIWKSLIIVIVAIAGVVFLVIPAQVVLVRVQASLLPPDEDTIVAFDRSFGGKLEPVIVGGKGYVSYMDAWKTFSRESWIRLYKLLGKILLATLAVYLVVVAITVPEVLLMLKASKPVDSN